MTTIRVWNEDAERIKALAQKVVETNDVSQEFAEAEVVSALLDAVARNGIDINEDFIWS